MEEAEFQKLQALGRNNREIRLFLDRYDYNDVSVLKLNPSSRSSWAISPANLQQMIGALRQPDATMQLHFSWEFQRRVGGADVDHSAGDRISPLEDSTKQQIINALTNQQAVVRIETTVPLYFETKNGNANFINFVEGEGPFGLGKLTLTMKSQNGVMWWEVSAKCEGEAAARKRQQLPQQDCERVVVYVFSQKRVSGIFKFFTTKGIIGLYLSFVLLAWSFVRSWTSGLYVQIKFSCLPNLDSIIQLSTDLNLARESEEFALEEDLYAKLLFLYRSPETMIKWTRFREEELRPPEEQPAIEEE